MPIYRYFPHNTAADDRELEKKIFRHSLLLPAFVVGLFWLVKIVEIVLGVSFVKGGVYPHHLKGIHGILTSPFIHSGFPHLISNSIPFFILMFALVYFYRRYSYRIFWQLYILSGLCVWIAGREAWHIGASGVVYGMAAFHLVSGIIRNDVRLLTLSVVVVFLYGGMVWGMFPINPDISWESHLWGALSGIVLAVYYRGYSIRRNPFEWENDEEEENETDNETPTISPGTPINDQVQSGNLDDSTANRTSSTLQGDLPSYNSDSTHPNRNSNNTPEK